jgi:hypothetical protein
MCNVVLTSTNYRMAKWKDSKALLHTYKAPRRHNIEDNDISFYLRGNLEWTNGIYCKRTTLIELLFLATSETDFGVSWRSTISCGGYLAKHSIKVSSRDSAVGIATGYWLDYREVGVRVPVGSRIFSPPSRPDRLWGPPNLLFNGYRELFSWDKAAGEWS